jgi:hypothetical protein
MVIHTAHAFHTPIPSPHPWSSTPPMPFTPPYRPPYPDRCMLPCRPPHPDHHGQCSPGCPWHPCSMCVARAGRVCRPTLHDGHAAGVGICGSAKTSAPPQGNERAHQDRGRLSWQRPLRVSARRGERCTNRPWTLSFPAPREVSAFPCVSLLVTVTFFSTVPKKSHTFLRHVKGTFVCATYVYKRPCL